MPVSNYTVRIDDNLRKDATELFERMGLTLPAAINAFLRQSVSEQRMPFMLGEAESENSQKQIPVGIEWPHWDDGTLFDPREIGSRRFCDQHGKKTPAHVLSFDGGVWVLHADGAMKPMAFVDGQRFKTFPRAMFEGWRSHGKGDYKCGITTSELDDVMKLIGKIDEAQAVYDVRVAAVRKTLDCQSFLADILAEQKLVGTPERIALDGVVDNLEDYLMQLSDEAVKSLEAIISLGETDNLKSFAEARDYVWDYEGWSHKECAEGCVESVSNGNSALKAGIAKMTASDWETLAE